MTRGWTIELRSARFSSSAKNNRTDLFTVEFTVRQQGIISKMPHYLHQAVSAMGDNIPGGKVCVKYVTA